MRFKWVPEPPETIADVEAIHRAIPLVPASESTCLQRIVDRETPIETREEATRWLTFLRALEVIEQTPNGYRRKRVDLTGDELSGRLSDGIYGARELHDLLARVDDPMSVDELTDRAAELPTWERHHHTDHTQVHRRRQRRLVEWFVLCGLAGKTPAGYRLFTDPRQ